MRDASELTGNIWLDLAAIEAEARFDYVPSKLNAADSVSREDWAIAKSLQAELMDGCWPK